MSTQAPSLGRVVIYRLTDAERASNLSPHGNNGAAECPATIVRVFSDTCVNLKLLNDGEGVPWRTSVLLGTGGGQWSWPVFVPPKVATPQDPSR